MSEYDDIAARFVRDAAKHEMTVLHDDGLYRHLRYASPKSNAYWFDVVTWPGSLAIRGDIDGHMFTRITDMFEFFRRKHINPGYWAEKLEGGRDSVKVYSEELFVQLVKEHVADAIRHGDAPRGISRAVRDEILNSPDLHFEERAREALAAFEFKGFRFDDTWEWDFRDYDWSFLWACHAIVWGIRQYDAARTAVAA